MSKVGPKKRKIMLTLAITVDVIQFLIGLIPVVGQIINFCISIIVWPSFLIWLLMLGVPILPTTGKTATKKTTRIIIGWIADVIPVVNMFWPSFYIFIDATTSDLELNLEP
jgi:hypothetical protein